jgi:3-oxoacyl-[acyl-carrier-protein] synthase-3
MALKEAITTGRLKRGQTILIIGTGAGFSMGGLIIKY